MYIDEMENSSPAEEETIIPLDVAKQAIVKALSAFDKNLGIRANAILYNPDRLNLTEETSQKTGMMQCRPAGVTEADLRDSDMYFEDFAERFGPHFTEQENPNDYSIIDYEYTYTQSSVLDLAHELGHAIADDIQRESGKNFRNFTPNKLEEQAYFIQSIVSQPFAPAFNAETAELKQNAVLELANGFNRANQRSEALTAFEEAQTMSPDRRHAFVIEFMGGDPIDKGNSPIASLRSKTPKNDKNH